VSALDAESDARRFAPATERNRAAILAVLQPLLPDTGCVVEIASGSGQHAVWFAQQLPALTFQPSDPEAAHRASIAAWIAHSGVTNVLAPVTLDATAQRWSLPAPPVAVLCINMIHIAPWEAALGLVRNAATTLPAGGFLYLYGPFRQGGRHTSESNASFDADLRARHPAWGVRDLEAVTEAAAGAGFALEAVVTMPANNLSVVLRR
jgi:hypothetical protein